jgi:hypothetical protein
VAQAHRMLLSTRHHHHTAMRALSIVSIWCWHAILRQLLHSCGCEPSFNGCLARCLFVAVLVMRHSG